MSFSVQAEAVQWLISLLGTCVKWQWLDNGDSWWTRKLNFRFWLSFLYVILYPPKPVMIPHTRASGRRVWAEGPLGQGTATGALQLFCKGQWWWWPWVFLCSVGAARILPCSWRLSCDHRWGTIAWITFHNEVMMVIWQNSVTLAAKAQFPAFSAWMKLVLFFSKMYVRIISCWSSPDCRDSFESIVGWAGYMRALWLKSCCCVMMDSLQDICFNLLFLEWGSIF